MWKIYRIDLHRDNGYMWLAERKGAQVTLPVMERPYGRVSK